MKASTPNPIEMILSRRMVSALILAGAIGLIWINVFGIVPSEANADLYQTYLACDLYRHGHIDSVYQPSFFADQTERTKSWSEGMRTLNIPAHNNGTFAYSPAYFLLSLPLTAALSLPQFGVLFFWLNALSAAIVGLLCVRMMGGESRVLALAAGLGAGVVAPSVYAASLGQNTLLVLALILTGFALIERRNNWMGGTLLVLAFVAKPWTIALLPVVVIYSDWRLLLKIGAAYLSAAILVPRLALPSALTSGYAEAVRRMVSLSVVAYNNCSIRALIHRLYWNEWTTDLNRWPSLFASSQVTNVELALVIGICMIFLFGVFRNLRRKPLVLAAALVVVLVPLGICWTHYVVLALPATAFALLSAGEQSLVRFIGWANVVTLVGTHLLLGRTQMPAAAGEHPALYATLFFAPLLVPICLVAALLFSPPSPSLPTPQGQ